MIGTLKLSTNSSRFGFIVARGAGTLRRSTGWPNEPRFGPGRQFFSDAPAAGK
jgi:hypothetical protein